MHILMHKSPQTKQWSTWLDNKTTKLNQTKLKQHESKIKQTKKKSGAKGSGFKIHVMVHDTT